MTTRETEVCFMGLSRDRVLIKTGLINNRSKALIMDKYEGFEGFEGRNATWDKAGRSNQFNRTEI